MRPHSIKGFATWNARQRRTACSATRSSKRSALSLENRERFFIVVGILGGRQRALKLRTRPIHATTLLMGEAEIVVSRRHVSRRRVSRRFGQPRHELLLAAIVV